MPKPPGPQKIHYAKAITTTGSHQKAACGYTSRLANVTTDPQKATCRLCMRQLPIMAPKRSKAPPPTAEELQEALFACARKHGYAAAKRRLNEHGFRDIKNIPYPAYQRVLDALKE